MLSSRPKRRSAAQTRRSCAWMIVSSIRLLVAEQHEAAATRAPPYGVPVTLSEAKGPKPEAWHLCSALEMSAPSPKHQHTRRNPGGRLEIGLTIPRDPGS